MHVLPRPRTEPASQVHVRGVQTIHKTFLASACCFFQFWPGKQLFPCTIISQLWAFEFSFSVAARISAELFPFRDRKRILAIPLYPTSSPIRQRSGFFYLISKVKVNIPIVLQLSVQCSLTAYSYVHIEGVVMGFYCGLRWVVLSGVRTGSPHRYISKTWL